LYSQAAMELDYKASPAQSKVIQDPNNLARFLEEAACSATRENAYDQYSQTIE
jgi:hypothetical protein